MKYVREDDLVTASAPDRCTYIFHFYDWFPVFWHNLNFQTIYFDYNFVKFMKTIKVELYK